LQVFIYIKKDVSMTILQLRHSLGKKKQACYAEMEAEIEDKRIVSDFLEKETVSMKLSNPKQAPQRRKKRD